MTKVEQWLKWARYHLGCEHRFWWNVAGHFPTVYDPELPPNVYGCTDGVDIRIGPKSGTLPKKEKVLGVLGHEFVHIILHHTKGMPNVRYPDVWRKAQEIVTEQNIPYGFDRVDDELTKAAVRFDQELHLHTEPAVYQYLLDHPEEQEKIPMIDIVEFKGDPDEVTAAILAAITASEDEGFGYLPAGLKFAIEKLREPRINWRTHFSQYVGSKIGQYGLVLNRFSKAFLPLGLYVPPLARRRGFPDIVMGIDTSGSMVGDPLREVLSEMRGMAGLVFEATAFLFDAAVQEELRFDELNDDRIDWLSRNLKGKGGTSFVPFFDTIREKDLHPQLAIILTDTEGTFPEVPPPYPVLWVTTTSGEVPFGDVVRIPPEEFMDTKEAA